MKEWLEIRNKFDAVRLQNSIEKAQKLDDIDCAYKEIRFWKVKYMERNAKLEEERQREYAKFRNAVARRRAEEAERNNRKEDGQ